MKLSKIGKINAPIEVVFSCLTDIEYFREEVSQALKGQDFKINYDRKDPFGIRRRIVVSTMPHALFATITRNDSPNYLSMDIEPNKKYLGLIGVVQYSAKLEKLSDNKTKYSFVYESNKDPRGLLKLVLFLLGYVSFYFANKRMIKRIKDRAKKGAKAIP